MFSWMNFNAGTNWDNKSQRQEIPLHDQCLRMWSSNRSLIMKGKAQASLTREWRWWVEGQSQLKECREVKDMLINTYGEPRGGGTRGREDRGTQVGCRVWWGGRWGGALGEVEIGGGGWVRIMVVKLLFPPAEKKGVNDTLVLPTPTRCSSLSFMEGERHTEPFGGEEATETAMPSHRPANGRL